VERLRMNLKALQNNNNTGDNNNGNCSPEL
jgi:hypothetical protein